jgi:hypothetical protein
MSIDDHVLQAMNTVPFLHNHLNLYAETGFKTYAIMIEDELNHIKKHYGPEVYNKLNHIYQGIKSIYKNDKP